LDFMVSDVNGRATGFRVTRRALLAGAVAVIGQPAPQSSAWAQSSDALPDALQDWLMANAVPIRAIDARDEDFSDLQPLADRIGGARVVQLGEPSHSAGSCFAAKARLVKFLHRRMGFDVVIWESGLYDVERVEAGLRTGEDAVAAARRGILMNWAASEEVRPLFEYARASHAGDRPLAMAGFDMTVTGAFAELAAELRSFAGALHDPGLRRDAMAATADVIEAFGRLNAYVEAEAAREAGLVGVSCGARAEAVTAWERDIGAPLRPRRDALELLQHGVDRLGGLFAADPAAFAQIDGARRSGFMARIVASLGGRGATLYERDGVDVPADPDAAVAQENRRDALNAENLRWLIDEGYPDRKIIVWAHNAHVMNAYYEAPDFKSISLDPVPNAMKPHGVFLAEWLGDDLYTIGFTAYAGDDGWVGLNSTPIAPASENSLEARLHRLGQDHAFLDLRAARGAADHPLRGPQTVRVPKYDDTRIADATRPYDAIFFIAQMRPGTLIT
jgi:erythromycin esterase